MDLSVEQFVEGLLSNEALERPSDSVKPDELVLELPKWFDEKQYNKARRFYWHHCFTFSFSMLMGLVAVFAVPSILKVLVGTRRSNSVYTAYRRYVSTHLHAVSWFEHELKPGSLSWKSLYTVRSRHLTAGLASKLKGGGVVSQRDVALTQFGFIGFSILKPEKFGIRQTEPGDWEAYNHFWKVIGYMIGLEDRYNICRNTIEETRQVCQMISDRVYTPCLENVPEYYEHMATVMMDGMWHVNPAVDTRAALYFCRELANVPGYIYTETQRIDLQRRIKEHLKGKDESTGVDSRLLMEKPAVDGLPDTPPRLLYLHDYDTLASAPAYKNLTFWEQYNLSSLNLISSGVYLTYLGRIYFNFNFRWSHQLMQYFPYLAFFKFGIKQSLVNRFAEDPTDDTKPKPNAEYYKRKEQVPWYKGWLSIILVGLTTATFVWFQISPK